MLHVPQLHECFLEWLTANRHRFTAPIQVNEQTADEIRMVFSDITPAVTARLTPYQLLAESDGTVLVGLELPSVNVGYTCGLIWPHHAKVHASDEAMWVSYFERFLGWTNQKLG